MHLLFLQHVVQSGEGVGNEFIYIIAAVIGGCLLTGGYGSAVGAAIGAFIFGMTSRASSTPAGTRTGSSSSSGSMLLLATSSTSSVKRKAEAR